MLLSINTAGHPYKSLEDTPLWKHVYVAISDLVENGDLAESTRREYIVGYLCKNLIEAGLIAE